MAIFTPDELVQLATAIRTKTAPKPKPKAPVEAPVQTPVEAPVQTPVEAQAAPDWNATLVATGYNPQSNMLALCPDDWAHFGMDALRAAPGERLAKSLADLRGIGAPFCFPFEAPLLGEMLLKSQESDKNQPPTGGAGGSGERWITMHPHGDEEKGVPVRITQNHDKSWSVAGGAGGKLNGLRLTDVKSPEEYKGVAAEKAKARAEKKKGEERERFDKLKGTHRAQIENEAKEKGETLSPEELDQQAAKRASSDYQDKLGDRAATVDEAKDKLREHERAYIEHVAKTQGWDESEYKISDQALDEIRKNQEQQILAGDEGLKARLESSDPAQVKSAKTYLDKTAGRLVQKVVDKQHALALRRAREVESNLRDLIVSAADGINKDAMGDVAVGDLVRDTLGDGGKGYLANLQSEAQARGMDISDLGEQADAQNAQSRLERGDMDLERAASSEAFLARGQAAAARSRAEVAAAVEKLGEKGEGPLGKIQNLDTLPKTPDAKSAVEALASLKQLGSAAQNAAQVVRDVKSADPIDTLPKAAVVTASELSHAEALEQVLHDLDEKQRQRAMGELLDCYNAQDALSPLVSHRLSGHNSFFGNLAPLAGVRSLDPLAADILGPSAAAHVMRRAMENAAGEDKAKIAGLGAALEAHHIEKQVGIADSATERATELLNQADNLEDFPLDSMDALLAGLDQAKQKNDLVKEAREHLGVALGRLEAGAALNEAFQGARKDEVQVSLGATSTEDAILKAAALGLTRPDQFEHDGALKEEGQFRIFNDGKNKILILHGAGLDHLASGLQEDPEHLARAAKVAAIKAGEHDEHDWLPQGFSRRPAIDVSGGDALVIPRHDLQLDLNGAQDAGAIGAALKTHIARRLEAGQDPVTIANAVRAQSFRADHVDEAKAEAYSAALADVSPDLRAGMDALEHQAKIKALFGGYHGDWVAGEVAAGRMDSAHESLHHQLLPQDWKTHDLVHQVALQDPRLQHAFSDVGALSHQARRAVRQYAYEHVFRDGQGKAYDPKDKETPTQSLTPSERKAWEKWRQLSDGGKGDPYAAIQKHLGESAESEGGGLFGDDEPAQPHTFASVNLADDAAVIAAATKHAGDLGYAFSQDVAGGARSYPDLEARDGKSESEVAAVARRRIQGFLRDHALREMFGTPDLGFSPPSGSSAGAWDGKRTGYHQVFNPDTVATGSGRWAEYVAAMGGGDKESEARAYTSIQEKMKGDFAQRFAKGYAQLHGQPFQTAPVPLSFADAHSVASLPGERRKEIAAQSASERAKLQNRNGGKFGEDNTGAKLDAQRQGQLMGDSLFAVEDAREEKQQLDTHRLSLGGAAEAMVRGLMPNISLKKGTAAAGDINMSSGVGVKRQRAIKQLEAVGRIGLTLGVGSGKTAISLGAFSHLKKQGKVSRALMAVPSVVQEQFGSEAARFYDLTDSNHPTWHSDAGVSPDQRRAAYHHASGTDICVVTHQALRDDLNWALAQHKFDGDEDAAGQFLESAPETERNAAMSAAMQHHGWNFDLTAVDEGHNLLNRKGKENSGMANAIDAFTHDKPYHASMSADPVKNDASEGFDFLRKVAPHRYVSDDHPDVGNGKTVSRAQFLRKYGVNTPAAMEALQREMDRYHYAESIKPDTELEERFHTVAMTAPQQSDYNAVLQNFQRGRSARKRAGVDVEAVKALSPGSFEGVPQEQHEALAKRLHGSLGILRDAALDRVVNQHPQGAKLEWLDERLGLKANSGKYGDFDPKPAPDHCPIIFAHNLESVRLIQEHLAKQGLRTGKLDGTLTGADKEKAKLAFSPQFDHAAGKYVTDPTADVMICSDAGAVGWNGQRSRHVVQFDAPHTKLVHEQRTGRAYRVGQQHDVSCDTVLTDSAYERGRRKRLERKGAMRDALTSPSELIDDTGLAKRICEQTDAARSMAVKRAVDEVENGAANDTQTQNGPAQNGPAQNGPKTKGDV